MYDLDKISGQVKQCSRSCQDGAAARHEAGRNASSRDLACGWMDGWGKMGGGDVTCHRFGGSVGIIMTSVSPQQVKEKLGEIRPN